MRREDEDAVFGLRMAMWGAPNIEYVREGARLDPRYLDRTFAAVGPDGTALSTVRYWLREVRDASGTPQQVGCVASVVTRESARRQGHARRLMQMAIEAMREEGCAWSLLFSSDMGVPLYLGLGYHALPGPYFSGVLSGRRPSPGDAYRMERIKPPFDFEDESWRAVREIYGAYNARRLLSLVRDDAYWRGHFARRIVSRTGTHSVALFMARASGGEYAGYLLFDYVGGETARRNAGLDEPLDQLITISEVGVMPGHEQAMPTMLSGMLDAAARGLVGASARLPREGRVYQAIGALFGPQVRTFDCQMMALPLAEDTSHDDIAAIASAPGAVFWIADDF
jgi:GNAT superfamily N-acetyltransferase